MLSAHREKMKHKFLTSKTRLYTENTINNFNKLMLKK